MTSRKTPPAPRPEWERASETIGYIRGLIEQERTSFTEAQEEILRIPLLYGVLVVPASALMAWGIRRVDARTGAA